MLLRPSSCHILTDVMGWISPRVHRYTQLIVVLGGKKSSYNHHAEMGIRRWRYHCQCCTFDCRSWNVAIHVNLTASRVPVLITTVTQMNLQTGRHVAKVNRFHKNFSFVMICGCWTGNSYCNITVFPWKPSNKSWRERVLQSTASNNEQMRHVIWPSVSKSITFAFHKYLTG